MMLLGDQRIEYWREGISWLDPHYHSRQMMIPVLLAAAEELDRLTMWDHEHNKMREEAEYLLTQQVIADAYREGVTT
jgi:hypothetical protein